MTMKKYGFFWFEESEYWFALQPSGWCELEWQENLRHLCHKYRR
jgi:hypothetical protein